MFYGIIKISVDNPIQGRNGLESGIEMEKLPQKKKYAELVSTFHDERIPF